MAQEPRIRKAKLTEFMPDPENANEGTERGTAFIEDSVQKYGAGRSLLADKRGTLIAGNKTQQALVDAGFEDVIVVTTQGDTPVIVQREDLDLEDDPEHRARLLAYSDNRASALSLQWDAARILLDKEKGVPIERMWTPDELNDLLAQASRASDGTAGTEPEAQLHRAEELQQKFGVERGQIWVIDSNSGRGTHRLMCGDSYSDEDYARLMQGATPDMLHTDPPYGISIVSPKGLRASDAADAGAKPFGSTSGTAPRSSTGFDSHNRLDQQVGYGTPGVNKIIQSNVYPVIEGDDRPFDPAFLLNKAPILVLWGANYYADKLPSKSCWIVWDKRENITRNNFADCELAWTNQDSPARIFYHLWNGLHKGSQHGERRIHPTEKPTALFQEVGREYADKGLWVDLFAGSGAQIVAAEQSGAVCYANEIEPLYVACVLQRLADMGLSPRLEAS